MSNVIDIPIRKDKPLDWLARALETAVRNNPGDAGVMLRITTDEAIALARTIDERNRAAREAVIPRASAPTTAPPPKPKH